MVAIAESSKAAARSRGHNTSLVRTCALMRRAKSGLAASSTGTAITPQSAHPRNAATHSAQFGLHRSTASPLPICALRVRGQTDMPLRRRDRSSSVRDGIRAETRRRSRLLLLTPALEIVQRVQKTCPHTLFSSTIPRTLQGYRRSRPESGVECLDCLEFAAL